MAVEDGLVLGLLLGRLQSSDRIPEPDKRTQLNAILRLFESLRKKRTTTNVKGAVANRRMCKFLPIYISPTGADRGQDHMHDGPEQEARDRELAEVDWVKPSQWGWADPGYQQKMLGFDSVADTNRAFEVWLSEESR